ncbi:MAG TPA: lipopolysaccharide core heptose(I) kinase RfaP [Gammaproteobacteria bacterium]|nr:lipopolysaccharide core heptose(I) kinase RfaP [Gammaproteobacteria bacterium]
MFYLQDYIKKHFSTTQPYFKQMMALKGECFRHREGRMTQRIRLGNNMYFIKQYHGVGWKEIIKNIIQLRWPVLGAKNEWNAINKLQWLGIPTANVVAFAQRGLNPAKIKSFIVMEELAPAISVETLCQRWITRAPSFSFKYALIKRIAKIARLMHNNGINHRDFYICHFLLDTSQKTEHTQEPLLYLIDLHRAQIRHKTPVRWIIKDLGSLYFSSKNVGITKRDYYRFMRIYQDQSLREIFALRENFWKKVKSRGDHLYANHC